MLMFSWGSAPDPAGDSTPKPPEIVIELCTPPLGNKKNFQKKSFQKKSFPSKIPRMCFSEI